MISNPDLIFYACVAKGSIILSEFSSSKQPGIEEIGKRCIEKTPSHHSIFSHTVRKKSYTFVIQSNFTYFVISDEALAKSEIILFLDRVKTSFEELMASDPIEDFDNPTHLCLQTTFYPVLRDILALDSDLVSSFTESMKENRTPSLDSRGTASPLLKKPGKIMVAIKKKKRALGWGGGGSDGGGEGNLKEIAGSKMDNKVNHVGENGNIMTNREFSVSMHKNHNNNNGNGFYYGDSKQKAKQIWRKHVWVVLILDLVICAVLFGIWLWVCRGFKCIDG